MPEEWKLPVHQGRLASLHQLVRHVSLNFCIVRMSATCIGPANVVLVCSQAVAEVFLAGLNSICCHRRRYRPSYLYILERIVAKKLCY